MWKKEKQNSGTAVCGKSKYYSTTLLYIHTKIEKTKHIIIYIKERKQKYKTKINKNIKIDIFIHQL